MRLLRFSPSRLALLYIALSGLVRGGFPVDHVLPSHVVSPLRALAPQQTEPPFLVAQAIVLVLFIVLTSWPRNASVVNPSLACDRL